MLYILLITTTLMQSGKSILFKKIGVIYREKQTVKGIVGFIIGCIAILIIGVF